MNTEMKFEDEYVVGFGYPYVYTDGLTSGFVFYADTDTRLSNIRETVFPNVFKKGNRNIPEYELILRRKYVSKRHKSETEDKKPSLSKTGKQQSRGIKKQGSPELIKIERRALKWIQRIIKPFQ